MQFGSLLFEARLNEDGDFLIDDLAKSWRTTAPGHKA
jgi:hypothetical protein